MLKIIKNNYFTLMLASMALLSCSNDDSEPDPQVDPDPVVVETEYATSGNIFSSAVIVNGTLDSYYVGYEEEGETLTDLDITAYSNVSNFFVRAAYKNYIFNRDVNGTSTSLHRYQVNKATGILDSTGSIQLTQEVNDVEIINDEVGLFTTSIDRVLYVFNPTTMELTTSIDLSQGKIFEENDDNFYNTIIYRAQDNKVFLPLYTDEDDTISFYDGGNSVWVEVVDLDSNSWEKTIEKTNAQYAITRGSGNYIVDETGNVYVTCQGSYGLDAVLPTDANEVYARPQILKIPSGTTEFDQEYSFNPVSTYDPTLAFKFAQTLSGTIYAANGIAYVTITTEADSDRFTELLGLFAQGLATDAEQAEFFNLVTNDATSRWAKLDLVNQTVEVIADMPLTAGFNYPMSFKGSDDSLYLSVFDSNGVNGVYKHNPETNTSELIHSITAGAGTAAFFLELTE